ncbi:MAG: outer membrane lipid asymmetry maintenance protein MlaD [Wenzhouxiangellaceae bacterium]|nr:outer membrane lipid asymmetry maintenance protein MlaD [Wenzhouxiangellaceae bacterium]
MKSSNQIEIAAGVFLLLGIAALVFLAVQATDGGGLGGEERYRVTATFNNIGGLKERATVSMGGVRIGTVEDIELDPETLEARVTLGIDRTYDDLPDDTSASVLTSGLLGDQYVGLEPGGSPEPLEDGDRILITNSALVLEQLISKYLIEGQSGQGGSGQ